MNPAPDPAQLAAKFLRLASIELRFARKNKYLDVVNLYCQQLGLTPLPDPQDVQPFYAYKIGKGNQAMELRFALKNSDDDKKKNRTIMYWEVPTGEIVTTTTALRSLTDYALFEPVTSSPNGIKPDSQRSIIEDPSGNLLGLIGNPPFPLT
ncbi:MAG: hypothetical protein EOO62_15850 [Hymenobacter sp.]|nr:MAG: hypothetical protein EOO62_15850 [Hymenobacter sp.]